MISKLLISSLLFTGTAIATEYNCKALYSAKLFKIGKNGRGSEKGQSINRPIIKSFKAKLGSSNLIKFDSITSSSVFFTEYNGKKIFDLSMSKSLGKNWYSGHSQRTTLDTLPEKIELYISNPTVDVSHPKMAYLIGDRIVESVTVKCAR